MEIWTIVGYVAATANTIELIPEVRKALYSHHLSDVSWAMLILMFCSSSLWAAYGVHLNDIPLIISGGVNATMEVTLMVLKKNYSIKHRKKYRIRSKVLIPKTQEVRVASED